MTPEQLTTGAVVEILRDGPSIWVAQDSNGLWYSYSARPKAKYAEGGCENCGHRKLISYESTDGHCADATSFFGDAALSQLKPMSCNRFVLVRVDE